MLRSRQAEKREKKKNKKQRRERKEQKRASLSDWHRLGVTTGREHNNPASILKIRRERIEES
jgi:hypothetical protein